MQTQPVDDRDPERPRRGWPLGVSVALALLVVVAAIAAWKAADAGSSASTNGTAGGPHQGASPLVPKSSPVGRPLPAATFTRLDGGESSFAAFRGRTLVVNFWQVDCTPCRTEMPALQRLHEKLGDRVAFLGIDSGDPASSAAHAAKVFGVHYDLALDPGESIVRSVGAIGFPTTLVVRPDGTVANIRLGAVNIGQLQGWIDQARS
jgi:thiol-disulfide isomerase/thioredoxin